MLIIKIICDSREVKGSTKEAESGAQTQSVYIFYQERLRDISLRGTVTEHNETIIMSVDKIESAARADFDEALNQLKRTNGVYIFLLFCRNDH